MENPLASVSRWPALPGFHEPYGLWAAAYLDRLIAGISLGIFLTKFNKELLTHFFFCSIVYIMAFC